LLAAIALHIGLVGAVLAYEPARSVLAVPPTIAVEWIAAPRVEEPRPAPKPVTPPKPRPVHKPKPVLAPAPSPKQAAEPPPAPLPEPVAVPAPPRPAPPQLASIAPAAPAAPAAPRPVTPPIFNADYLANPKPPYPALSRRLAEQGRVVLRVHVTPGGTVDGVEVRTSSGHPRLDDSALETVKGWKFVPAKQGAQPIAAWVLVPISFGLDS
jgi:protein TonB